MGRGDVERARCRERERGRQRRAKDATVGDDGGGGRVTVGAGADLGGARRRTGVSASTASASRTGEAIARYTYIYCAGERVQDGAGELLRGYLGLATRVMVWCPKLYVYSTHAFHHTGTPGRGPSLALTLPLPGRPGGLSPSRRPRVSDGSFCDQSFRVRDTYIHCRRYIYVSQTRSQFIAHHIVSAATFKYTYREPHLNW